MRVQHKYMQFPCDASGKKVSTRTLGVVPRGVSPSRGGLTLLTWHTLVRGHLLVLGTPKGVARRVCTTGIVAGIVYFPCWALHALLARHLVTRGTATIGCKAGRTRYNWPR